MPLSIPQTAAKLTAFFPASAQHAALRVSRPPLFGYGEFVCEFAMGIQQMSEDSSQKNVVVVAAIIGIAVLVIGLLGVWNTI
jgi:hypothetical protein|tara:strand:- start:44 stop:289 length:246 start_codon:yes stop_codon:yes gene_type:complete